MASTKYCEEDDIYLATGMTKEVIERVTEKTDDQIKDMIEGFIIDAEDDIRDQLGLPHVCALEKHLGTGEDDEFQLGQEDSNFYINIDVEDCVELIRACFFLGVKKKLPYPRNCDDLSEDYTEWDDSAGYKQPTNEALIKQAGKYSMEFDFTGATKKARYPDVDSSIYIDKNIDIYSYMCLRVRSSVANTTITIRLYNEAGSYNTATYLAVTANKWYLVMLDLDEDFNTTIDWDDSPLYYFEIEVDKACTLYADNINFNDDWCFTAPSGKLVIMRKSTDEPPADGYEFIVTYTYDPFKVSVPQNIKEATALYAGAKLIDNLIGIRQSMMAFEAESLTSIPDKESLYITRTTMLAKADKKLADYGFGWSGTIIE